MKLHCAFIDFEQAFDSVWYNGLWNKVLLNNIDGKCFKIITNMYKGIKSKVLANGRCSDFFDCTVGVRQGENLSPFLFSLYLNDLEEYLYVNNVRGLTCLSNKIRKDLNLYLSLFVLLYADDTILLSENPEEFQYLLNTFSRYCKNWHLKVNSKKTKVVIFGRGKNSNQFTFEGSHLEIVNNFKYLGVKFFKNNSFNLNFNDLYDKAIKAMYSCIGKCRKHNLAIDCKLDMFDKIVQPIFLYGCEVWGFQKTKLIEKLHLKFCKHILNLSSSTPNYMVYGELGRYPLVINIKVRMISFWGKLINSQNSKLSSKLFHVLKNYKNPWCESVKNILDDCGLSYIWQENSINIPWLKMKVRNILLDQFNQSWYSDVQNSPKSINYRLFKKSLAFEEYFLNLPSKLWKKYCIFRTGNAKLPIETGRWFNISRENRTCKLCICNEIGDEFHYLFNCSDICITDARNMYLPKYYISNPNVLKFEALFNISNKKQLIKICKFINTIIERVSSLG